MTSLADQDERALLHARVRRLERDLEGEREKNARERRTNAELALLTHELRCHAAGLEEEIAALKVALSRTAMVTT